jgi:hypothetical protein
LVVVGVIIAVCFGCFGTSDEDGTPSSSGKNQTNPTSTNLDSNTIKFKNAKYSDDDKVSED